MCCDDDYCVWLLWSWSHIDGGLFEVCMVVKREVRGGVARGCRVVVRGFVAGLISLIGGCVGNKDGALRFRSQHRARAHPPQHHRRSTPNLAFHPSPEYTVTHLSVHISTHGASIARRRE